MDVMSPQQAEESDVPSSSRPNQDYFSMLSQVRRQSTCIAIEKMQSILDDLYTDKK